MKRLNMERMIVTKLPIGILLSWVGEEKGKSQIEQSENYLNDTVLLQNLANSITVHISPSLSPPCRAGFPSIVTCETESAAHSAWPAIHSSWTDWWKTINRPYILLGHSGSQALILDTWTYILGYGSEVKHQQRGWNGNCWVGSGDTRLGWEWSRGMKLPWSMLSAFSLSRNNQ